MSNPLIANLSLLFADLPMAQRFEKAAKMGFSQVEIQFPYEWPADQLKQWADSAGVSVHLINVPAGELLQGGKSLSCHEVYRDDFIKACALAVEYGNILGVRCINVLASNLDEADNYTDCRSVYIENIRYAAEMMVHEGIQVCFEAINAIDMPAYLCNSFSEMKTIYDDVSHPNAFMQYDIYHMAMMGEPISEQITAFAPEIGHIQFADMPGRGAPGTGSLPLGAIFQAIDISDYSGAVAAEYRVSGDDSVDYGWLQAG